MPGKKAGALTVRAIMKKGRVEILEDVFISDGSLLDVVVVETAEEKSLKKAKQQRKGSADPLRFCFVGKKQLTDDPIVFLKRLATSKVSNVRFEKYRATCHVFPCDLQCAMAEFMLSLHPPVEKVHKLFRRMIRRRTRFEFNPGTRIARQFADEIKTEIEKIPIDFENGMSLWFPSISLIAGGVETVSNALVDINEYGPELAVEKAMAERKVGATKAEKIREQAGDEIELGLRNLVFDQLKRAVIRSRRKNSSPSESEKMIRKELSEIAKRLEASKA